MSLGDLFRIALDGVMLKVEVNVWVIAVVVVLGFVGRKLFGLRKA